MVEFISTISFELYLVHNIIIFGKFSLYHIIPNPIIGTIAVLASSCILAIMLHYICNYMKKIHIFKK
jgi:membrane-bound acyltransferase YfiQ involved in biofilm formation